MICSVLHYILSYEAFELHVGIVRLYCKHHFFYKNSLVPIPEHLYLYCYAKAFFLSICSCNCQNMVTKALLQVSVNRNRGHLIELNATELKSITCGKPTFACSFISCAVVELRDGIGDCHMIQYDLVL